MLVIDDCIVLEYGCGGNCNGGGNGGGNGCGNGFGGGGGVEEYGYDIYCINADKAITRLCIRCNVFIEYVWEFCDVTFQNIHDCSKHSTQDVEKFISAVYCINAFQRLANVGQSNVVDDDSDEADDVVVADDDADADADANADTDANADADTDTDAVDSDVVAFVSVGKKYVNTCSSSILKNCIRCVTNEVVLLYGE